MLENTKPALQIVGAISRLITSSLETGKSPGKAASYFLPSEDMAQMWSEMLAGLSHDLRTPLACIKGYVTTLLRKDVAWDPGDQKEFLGIIAEETDHIENLINNLLDSCTFSWKGEIELKREQVLLPQIVNKVLKDPSYRKKDHRFKVSFAQGFPFVEADPIRIEQVIRNLVDNAVKYSKENTLIELKGEHRQCEVVISLADQGVGIGDEDLSRLFEKFFRVTDGIREKQKGMGLGLPLVRQVLISHGGRIWAKSKLNQGTTFYFTLPCGAQSDI
jgi:K+-sensing histidine kinase KdpD